MTRVVGHRGAAGLAPENTVRGFERAVAVGADAVEFDVRACADGTPVVVHDRTVDRTTDGSGRVDALTVDELRALDAGDGEPVPTLADAVDALAAHDVELHVELKERGLAGAVLKCVRSAGVADRTVVISFLPRALSELPADAPVRTGLLVGDPTGALATAARFDADGLYVHHDHASADLLAGARERGLATGLWTVNEPPAIERALALAPDYVTSDRPDRVRSLRDG